jgi:hypothetical protein
MTTKHPEIVVRLTGPTNDSSIMDHVTEALRNGGIPNGEIDKFCDEVMASEKSELRQICGQWVTLVPAACAGGP